MNSLRLIFKSFVAIGQWANIAIRWLTLQYNDADEYIKRKSKDEFVGGLEVRGSIYFTERHIFI